MCNGYAVLFPRWDYGYALLKEAGVYDSAGKPVKQREVEIVFTFFKSFFSLFL